MILVESGIPVALLTFKPKKPSSRPKTKRARRHIS